MKPFVYHGEVLGESRRLFSEPRCRLSLLGLSGGSGGLGLSSGVGPTSNTSGGTNTITVNNGGGPLSTTTWLVIGAVALFGLLIFSMLHGRK